MDEPARRYADLPRAPVAAELFCPASGARVSGRVVELTGERAELAFEPGASLAGFDVGSTVDGTFISGALGGSHTLRGRVLVARMPRLALQFESRSATPLESLFNRRNNLRIRRDDLGVDRPVELALGDGPIVAADLDDLSMTGVALVLRRPPTSPRAGERVRLRIAGPGGLTVWLHGTVRHVSQLDRDVRLGIAFDLHIATTEGAAPALRELVRQLERAQLDQLALAVAGVVPPK